MEGEGKARRSAGASDMLTSSVVRTDAHEHSPFESIQSSGKSAVARNAAARTTPDMMIV